MSVPSQQKEAFLKAYDAYADALFRFCLAKLSHRERALDAVQEVFARTWEYLSEGKTIESMRSFLYSSAYHVVVDGYRKKKISSLDELTEEGFDIADDQGAVPLLSIESERLLKAVNALEDTYRDIMLMRYVGGLSPKEIAEVTSLSENVISVRIHRALEKLRATLNIHD